MEEEKLIPVCPLVIEKDFELKNRPTKVTNFFVISSKGYIAICQQPGTIHFYNFDDGRLVRVVRVDGCLKQIRNMCYLFSLDRLVFSSPMLSWLDIETFEQSPFIKTCHSKFDLTVADIYSSTSCHTDILTSVGKFLLAYVPQDHKTKVVLYDMDNKSIFSDISTEFGNYHYVRSIVGYKQFVIVGAYGGCVLFDWKKKEMKTLLNLNLGSLADAKKYCYSLCAFENQGRDYISIGHLNGHLGLYSFNFEELPKKINLVSQVPIPEFQLAREEIFGVNRAGYEGYFYSDGVNLQAVSGDYIFFITKKTGVVYYFNKVTKKYGMTRNPKEKIVKVFKRKDLMMQDISEKIEVMRWADSTRKKYLVTMTKSRVTIYRSTVAAFDEVILQDMLERVEYLSRQLNGEDEEELVVDEKVKFGIRTKNSSFDIFKAFVML